MLTALAVTGLAATPALAGKGGELRIEPAWYDGLAVSFLQPTPFSANPNGGVLACFGLGPDLSGINRPSQPLYVIFDDTATQDHCDGQPTVLRHDHVLSVAPGDPAYSGAWTIVLLVEAAPGSIDLAADPSPRQSGSSPRWPTGAWSTSRRSWRREARCGWSRR